MLRNSSVERTSLSGLYEIGNKRIDREKCSDLRKNRQGRLSLLTRKNIRFSRQPLSVSYFNSYLIL